MLLLWGLPYPPQVRNEFKYAKLDFTNDSMFINRMLAKTNVIKELVGSYCHFPVSKVPVSLEVHEAVPNGARVLVMIWRVQ